MKVLVTGATGLIGRKLVEKLYLKGHNDINVLSRRPEIAREEINVPVKSYFWDPEKKELDEDSLNGVDSIIHLAGSSLSNGVWNEERKKSIFNSRVYGTSLLLDALNKKSHTLSSFISASAIGVYGDQGSETIDESCGNGRGFLANVCFDWEGVLFNHKFNTRKVSLRTGVVLSPDGGALNKILKPFQMGLGGKFGSGEQYMSWIHIDDIVNMYIYAINHNIEGVFNAVSPVPVSNLQFTHEMGTALNRPTLFSVPEKSLEILMGEMSELLLNSINVSSSRIQKHGFKFHFSDISKALNNLLHDTNKGQNKFRKFHWVKEDVDKVFDFFTHNKNIQKLVSKNSDILLTSNDTKYSKGSVIDHQFNLYGIPLRWKSLVSHFSKDRRYTDIQFSGPYKKWVHNQVIKPFNGGTLIMDEVAYSFPFSIFTDLITSNKVKKDIESLYNYKSNKLSDMLGV